MKPTHGNPLIPASLAADGIQGADAEAQGSSDVHHSATEFCNASRARGRWRRKLSTRVQGAREAAALFLALIALDAARDQLDCYARLTDEPQPGAVEAADLLDAARDAMVTP